MTTEKMECGNFFRVKVSSFNDEVEGGIEVDKGYIFAHSYAEAAQMIYDLYYDVICDMSLMGLDTGSFITDEDIATTNATSF